MFENADFFGMTKENMENLADFPKFLMPFVEKAKEKKTPDEWLKMLGGVRESIDGGRNSSAASLVGKFLSALHHEFAKDDFEDGRFLPTMWDFLMWWNMKNTPPLPEKDLSLVFRSIIKRQ